MDIKPGIYTDISNEDYHHGPGVSRSKLWTLHTKTPSHIFAPKQETHSMKLGTLAHCSVTEPARFLSTYLPGPRINKNTIGWRTFVKEAKQSGMIGVDADEYEQAKDIGDKLRSDRELSALFGSSAIYEASAYWIDEMTGELCKCRPDIAIPQHMLGDLKTINDASESTIKKHVERYGYFVEEAWYRDGWMSATGYDCPMLFVFVEPTYPYAHRSYQLDFEYLKEGREIYRSALDMYHQCSIVDVWPGYSEKIGTLKPSSWFGRQRPVASDGDNDDSWA